MLSVFAIKLNEVFEKLKEYGHSEVKEYKNLYKNNLKFNLLLNMIIDDIKFDNEKQRTEYLKEMYPKLKLDEIKFLDELGINSLHYRLKLWFYK